VPSDSLGLHNRRFPAISQSQIRGERAGGTSDEKRERAQRRQVARSSERTPLETSTMIAVIVIIAVAIVIIFTINRSTSQLRRLFSDAWKGSQGRFCGVVLEHSPMAPASENGSSPTPRMFPGGAPPPPGGGHHCPRATLTTHSGARSPNELWRSAISNNKVGQFVVACGPWTRNVSSPTSLVPS
jgi:hypothetical protein